MIHYLEVIFGTPQGIKAKVESSILGYYITAYESQIFIGVEESLELKLRISMYFGAYWNQIGENNTKGVEIQ